MERPEAQDAGTIILTGFDPEVVIDSVKMVIKEHAHSKYKQIPPEYAIENTSWRVLKLVQGMAKLSNKLGDWLNQFLAELRRCKRKVPQTDFILRLFNTMFPNIETSTIFAKG